MLAISHGCMRLSSEDLVLHDQVGVGRTAEVYRGDIHGSLVAVKTFHCPLGKMCPKQILNLEREIEIMQAVQHPLLVGLVGIITDESQLQIVLDFCGGGPLFDLLHNCYDIDLTPRTQLHLLRDTAEAMAYLHSVSPTIIHRDLKSLNVLLLEPVLSEDDSVNIKLCDFGQARRIETEEARTERVGTVHWMAPEVLLGHSYCQLADVFSFAMFMFEVICREVPFEELSEAKVAQKVACGERPEMEAIPPDCPLVLVELMVRCWLQKPSSRPKFSVIIEELDSISALFSSQHKDADLLPRVQLFCSSLHAVKGKQN